MTRPGTRFALLAALAVTACSSTDKAPASAALPAEAGQEWERLVSGEWTLPPGGEEPRLCITKKLEEDVYIHAIRPVHPPGTHHTILSIADTAMDCISSLVGNGLIYGAGVGSEGLTMPPGVAMKLPKGMILNLGLHLYNTSDQGISGESAIEVVRMDEKDVVAVSEAMLSGPFTIAIPPGRQTIHHSCAVTDEQTIYEVFPHMHQMGVHFKTTLVVGGVPKVIHDGAYDFEEQFQIPIDPIVLRPGDSVETDCTFENPTNRIVTFGESSDTEMCFSVLFRYPALGKAFCGGTGMSISGPPCAKAGDPGNAEGVGRYCTKGGGECMADGGGTASMCLANVTTGAFGNFCTSLCSTDAECGAGAKCLGSSGRTACIPDSCAASLSSGDGGKADGSTPSGG